MSKRAIGALTSVVVGAALIPTGAAAAPAAPEAPAQQQVDAGTWYETAFVSWTGGDDSYRAYVRTDGAYDWRDGSAITGWLTDWQEVDAELVREVDAARDTWRVDVPGLPRGTYDVQVRADDGTTVVTTASDLTTQSFPRNGAAFIPSDEDVYGFPGSNDLAPEGAVGGYLPDGRVDPASDVVYLTPETMGDLPADLFSADRDAPDGSTTPLVLRVLGTIGSFETVAATAEDAGAQVPPGLNSNRMMVVGAGNGNVTIEGVGTDATLFGWGVNSAGASNLEIRNLNIDQWFDDAISLSGGGTGTRASNVWVHHNTFGYGQNKHLALGQDPDQAKGDGAVDVVDHARNYTIGYNHFAGSSKAMLIGGGVGSISEHYGTVHHNWFEGSEERTPRVRNGRVHVFNNLYQDVQGHEHHNQLLERKTGYGIGAAHNANVWAEGNLFDDVNYPFLRSRQGHARGSQPIDYQPGPGESADANAGFNHFFGDAPGFIVSYEAVTEGDFPTSVDGFRQNSDVMPGLTDAALTDLRDAALLLEPNVLDAASRQNFDPSQDVGVVVASGSTATNPSMSSEPAQLDWSFRPHREGVWATGTPDGAAALRTEIETRSGAQQPASPSSAPMAPAVTGVTINDEVRSAVSEFIPEPGLVVVVPDTFTIEWSDDDVLASGYELQWDQGSGDWTTVAEPTASARPTSFITQEMNQFALPESVEVLAAADDRDGQYLFRVRAVNDAGVSPWSPTYALGGELVEAVPSAEVTKQPGPTNELAVTVTEVFSDGLALAETETFTIRNNADGVYDVGAHRVYVATTGNTKVRDIRIIE